MNVPGPQSYPRIWYVNDDVWHLKFSRNLSYSIHQLDGLCDPSETTIYIRQRQSKMDTLQTFLHEIMHAIEFSYDFDIGSKKNYTERDMHNYIHAMERYLAEFLVDNWDNLGALFFSGSKYS